MNMMSVLLGATGLLLVVALVLSLGSLNKGIGQSSSQEQIAELKAEVLSLRHQEEELRALRHDAMSPPPPITTTHIAPANMAQETQNLEESAVLTAENDALKDQIAELKEQVSVTEKKADTYKEEAGLAWQKNIESHNKSERRARLIREALLIATVTEWAEEDGFAVISIQRPEAVQEGTILGIRRNDGLLGQVRISQLYEGGQATADPHLFREGIINIQAGDELIVPPL